MRDDTRLRLEWCAMKMWVQPNHLREELLEEAVEALYQKLLAGWVPPLPDPKDPNNGLRRERRRKRNVH